MPDLVRRVHQRSQLSSLQAALRKVRAADRILGILCHLVSRWGRVTDQGLVIPFRLTHSVLADLVAVECRTVSTQLGVLTALGAVRMNQEKQWVVSRAALSFLGELDVAPELDTPRSAWDPTRERRLSAKAG